MSKSNPRILLNAPIKLGCDPELFFSRKQDAKIAGSERIIPKNGLEFGDEAIKQGKFTLDGIQVELNPAPDTCRARLANRIAGGFNVLQKHMEKFPEFQADFSAVVDVDEEELSQLSPRSNQLLCAPSLNIYEPDREISIPPNYRVRSAGGHIHLGLTDLGYKYSPSGKYDINLMGHRDKLILILDIILGNTCVLIDRDPRAVERRQLYGRAGEYRLPVHGLEYRVLSNFWLRSYPVFSLVMNLVRLAASVVFSSIVPRDASPIWDESESMIKGYRVQKTDHKTGKYLFHDAEQINFADELLSKIDQAKVVHAINTNNATLARENFNILREWLGTLDNFRATTRDHAWPLGENVWDEFDYFVEKGLEYWFHPDPFHSWALTKLDDLQSTEFPYNGGWLGKSLGWETFLFTVVRNRMEVDKWQIAKAS